MIDMEAAVVSLKFYTAVFIEGLRKITWTFSY